MNIALIVATDRQGVIGRNGSLPWHSRSDLQRFKRLTMGHAMVMGRKTYDSIGRPLPGRRTIVLSRSTELEIPSVWVANSVEQAIELGRRHAAESSSTETPHPPTLFVVGGAEIYGLFLDRATELHLTTVEASVEGDTWFPSWDLAGWHCVDEERCPVSEHDQFATIYRKWVRD